ncbi:hypothetical protein LJC55_02810 [Eubacteriales bacterium OttesenSCG-928-N14]|nr:hypothetical protein [Eubacteriales bacterium OttesenSCG-928-N14]
MKKTILLLLCCVILLCFSIGCGQKEPEAAFVLNKTYDYTDASVTFSYGDGFTVYPVAENKTIIVGIGKSASYFKEGAAIYYEVTDETGRLRDRHFILYEVDEMISAKDHLDTIEQTALTKYDDFAVVKKGPEKLAGNDAYLLHYRRAALSKDGSTRMADNYYYALQADNGKNYVVLLFCDDAVTDEERDALFAVLDSLKFY